jgi:hypothetical protein
VTWQPYTDRNKCSPRAARLQVTYSSATFSGRSKLAMCKWHHCTGCIWRNVYLGMKRHKVWWSFSQNRHCWSLLSTSDDDKCLAAWVSPFPYSLFLIVTATAYIAFIASSCSQKFHMQRDRISWKVIKVVISMKQKWHRALQQKLLQWSCVTHTHTHNSLITHSHNRTAKNHIRKAKPHTPKTQNLTPLEAATIIPTKIQYNNWSMVYFKWKWEKSQTSWHWKSTYCKQPYQCQWLI